MGTDDKLWYFGELINDISRKAQRLSLGFGAFLDNLNEADIEKYSDSCRIIGIAEDIDLDSFTGGEQEVNEYMPPKYADGSFRTRTNNILEYRFMHNGKLKSVYGKTRDICWDKRTDLISGKKKSKKQTIYTYSEWIEKWYATYKEPRNGEASLKNMRYFMDRDIIPKLGKTPLKSLTGLMLQDFLNEYKHITNTQQKIANILRGSLRKAFELNMIKSNPYNAVELEPHKAESYEVLEINEQRLLLESIDNKKYYDLFLFSCCTGLRIGEALKVKTEHIDKKRKVIKVVKKETRTKGGSREVPYLDSLIKNMPQDNEYLFSDITYSGASNYFSKLYKKLGIKATLHSTRHTFISCCYHIGIKDKQIQKWAGHADIMMTLNTYTHILDSGSSLILDYLKELKNKLDI